MPAAPSAPDSAAERESACRLGFLAGCPYRSCAIAGACMAPAPSDDHEDL